MRKEERRTHVLRCAQEIFANKGYHSASVSDIVEHAGIARGTFYLYFDSKRAVFDELLDELVDMLDQRLLRIDPEHDVLEQLRANVARVLDLFLDHRELTRILVHEAVGLDVEFDEKLRQLYQRIHTMVEASLKLGVEMGLVRNCDTWLAARCVIGSVKEIIYHLVVEGGGKTSEPDRAHLMAELVAYSLVGLGASHELRQGTGV